MRSTPPSDVFLISLGNGLVELDFTMTFITYSLRNDQEDHEGNSCEDKDFIECHDETPDEEPKPPRPETLVPEAEGRDEGEEYVVVVVRVRVTVVTLPLPICVVPP